jgi:hypothetical protein
VIAAKQKVVTRLLAATEGLRLALGEKDSVYVQSNAKLQEETSALQKMVKKNEPKNASWADRSKATAVRLQRARQDVETLQTEKKKRREAGTKAAEEKHCNDLKAVDILIEELKERRVRICDQYSKAQEAWATRRKLLNEHEEEVLRLFNSKIKAVGPVGGASPQAPGVEVPGVDVEVPAGEVDSDSDGDYGEFADLTLRWNPVEQPVAVLTEKPKGEIGEDVQRLWNFYQALPWGTQCPPVSYRQMGIAKIETVVALISQPAMSKLYGERAVTPDDYVPLQVMEAMKHVLTLGNQLLSTQAQAVADAETRINEAYELTKNSNFQRCNPHY